MIFYSLLFCFLQRTLLSYQAGDFQILNARHEILEQLLLPLVHMFYQLHGLWDRQRFEFRLLESPSKGALNLLSEQDDSLCDFSFFFRVF